MAAICIRCVRTVPSTKQLMPGKIFKLSALDQSMQWNNLRIIYYYKFPGKELAIKRLSRSLSETLTSFPAITGRLQRDDKGHWHIKSNDAGVRVIEATAKVSLDEWMKFADTSDELRLTYWDHEHENSYVWSPLHIQLTEFEGGGLSIGLSCTHLVADMESLDMLVKAWANTHASKANLIKPPLFYPLASKFAEKSFSKPTNDIIEFYKSMTKQIDYDIPSLDSGEHNYASVTFLFTEDAVSKCIREAQLCSIDRPTLGVFEALAALFWISCSKAKENHELVDMLICVDMRKTMGFSSEFFGNAMVFNEVHDISKLQKGDQLCSASRAILDVVGKMEEEAIDFVAYMDSDTNEFSQLQRTKLHYGPDLVCVNLENLSPYSATFEEGIKPFHVSYQIRPVIGKGQILIIPSPQGGLSRIVVATLPSDQTIKLKEETDILRLNPTILEGMKKRMS